MSEVLYDKDAHVVTLTLNRPERMNAISGAMLESLSSYLIEADADPDARVVLLTGAGRGFCAGLDLKDLAAGGGGSSLGNGGGGDVKINQHPPFVLRRIDTPTLCALNGPAAGYGMDMALGCDLVLASDQARFVFPVRRGVLPESGSTWLLPRMLGWRKASEVMLVGRPLDAEQMLELGLVNRVIPGDELLKTARAWADEIAGNAPLAVSATKRTMRLGLDATFEANTHHVMAELAQLFRSRDFAEGVAAFSEKREPKFQGR